MKSPTTPSKISATSSAAPKWSALEAALSFPPIFSASCHWSDPWLVAAGTRVGSRHSRAGTPTDDAVLITRCGPHILLAIADGAGSPKATHSAEAAQRAVLTATAEANRSFPITGLDGQLLVDALAASRIDLIARSQELNLDPAAFATTLMLVLLAGDRIIAARIGDGSIYTWERSKLTRFCPARLPDIVTPMLVQPTWRDWLTTADSQRDFIQGIIICSDGADDFFLEANAKTGARSPSPSVINAFSQFCDQYGPTAALGYVVQMLNDPAWAKKTADDRSLIIAIKPQSPRAKPDVRQPT